MKDVLINLLGYALISYAIFYKRNGDSKIKIHSKEWFAVLVIAFLGAVLLNHSN